MGMSMWVAGFVPPDETYRKKREAYLACRAAGINPPDELEKFFDYQEPSEHGYEKKRSELGAAVVDWSDDSSEGFEIDLSKLPANVKRIRFSCSW